MLVLSLQSGSGSTMCLPSARQSLFVEPTTLSSSAMLSPLCFPALPVLGNVGISPCTDTDAVGVLIVVASSPGSG